MRRVLPALWLGLLLLPNISTLAFANAWEAPAYQLLLSSLWMAAFAWWVLPRKVALVLMYPVLLAGLAVVVADVAHSVNLLELIAVWFTFSEAEVAQSLRLHAGALVLAAVAVFVLLCVLWRGTGERPRTAWRVAIVLAGLTLAFVLPAGSWRNAWPSALAGAALEGRIGDVGLPLSPTPDVRSSPRDRFKSWQARREGNAPTAETYVLVIGESVRSDRLPACGGRQQVTAAPAGAIVFCDILSGSSSTHTSVPLLLSRALPGSRDRVPRDGTVLKAFEEAGFETFWFGVQERSIAWPDAQNQAFEPAPRLDSQALLPLLDQALGRPAPRKLIVLHAYNAHAPYHERYRPESAPFPLQPGKPPGTPTRQNLGEAWNDYDNAIDETMRFLQAVVNRLQAQEGASLLLFTADHAENMLDDARGLTYHALKMPTVWDTAVPGILWTSPAWRQANAGKWQMLSANRQGGLMHMDLVPTLLGAAGIRYAEPRDEPVDLTARMVPSRVRFTHVRAGETITLDALRGQAR
jgi:glucan phosphoethanolaminetransferase (alkaline phosphatase superfamily)